MPVVRVLTLLFAVSLGLPAWANTVSVINFEGLVEGTAVTNQFSGVTFTNATVLTAGSSLNEFEFPPQSGLNAVFDDGGGITISFSSPVLGVGGYFDYMAPVTLQAFDSSNTLLGSVTSSFFNNLALSGDAGSSANEFLQLNFATGIAKVTLTGDPSGGSFTFDDLTVTTSAQVPEPGTVVLMLSGLMASTRFRKQRLP
jgi:hypothetical protein